MSNGSFISKEQGKDLIDEYQSNHPNEIKAELFDANLVQQLLDQTGAEGVRVYYGQKDNGDNCLVWVATDVHDDDMTNGQILEMGTPCPSKCDPNSFFSS